MSKQRRTAPQKAVSKDKRSPAKRGRAKPQSPESAASRAESFRATRHHHSTETAEDYTELIADLLEEHGEARTVGIARALGISHVTALRTIRRLQAEGYVTTSPHQPILLTEKGAALAKHAKARHLLLVDFFIQLGVPADVAEIDVEGAEHHLSDVTLARIRAYMKAYA